MWHCRQQLRKWSCLMQKNINMYKHNTMVWRWQSSNLFFKVFLWHRLKLPKAILWLLKRHIYTVFLTIIPFLLQNGLNRPAAVSLCINWCSGIYEYRADYQIGKLLLHRQRCNQVSSAGFLFAEPRGIYCQRRPHFGCSKNMRRSETTVLFLWQNQE